MDLRWVAYGGSALLAAVSLIPVAIVRSPTAGPAATVGRVQVPAAETSPLLDVERRTERLARYQADPPRPSASGRNPFRYRAADLAIELTPPTALSPPADAIAPAESPVGEARLRLVGMVERAEGLATVRVGVISDGHELHLVRPGDRVRHTYVVAEVGVASVTLQEDNTEQRVQLLLRP